MNNPLIGRSSSAKAKLPLSPKKAQALAKKLKTIKEKKDFADAFEDKYFDLVWIARAGRKKGWNKQAQKMIPKKYPEEVKDLGGKDGDWHHGFNSGCLATVRLLKLLFLYDTEARDFALQNFPELST